MEAFTTGPKKTLIAPTVPTVNATRFEVRNRAAQLEVSPKQNESWTLARITAVRGNDIHTVYEQDDTGATVRIGYGYLTRHLVNTPGDYVLKYEGTNVPQSVVTLQEIGAQFTLGQR